MMPEPSYYQQLFLRRIKREKQLIVLWRTAVFLFVSPYLGMFCQIGSY